MANPDDIPTNSNKRAKGMVKANAQVSKLGISPYAHATTPDGTAKHISSVYHATLLYRSSCVGIYILLPCILPYSTRIVKFAKSQPRIKLGAPVC